MGGDGTCAQTHTHTHIRLALTRLASRLLFSSLLVGGMEMTGLWDFFIQLVNGGVLNNGKLVERGGGERERERERAREGALSSCFDGGRSSSP